MRHQFITFLLISLVFSGCISQPKETIHQPVRIIFDTDIGPDYDDVGALAFLHAMADSGKAMILATIASNKHELVAPSIDVINTFFGRENLPVGAPKKNGVSMTASQHWPDSIIAKYPHKIHSTNEVPDAVQIYRKVLSAQPDSSVTIVTVGFLTNLSNLIQSQPDSISSLNGIELISKKVKRLVSMAGRFPEGREFNIFMDSTSSEYVFNEWPVEVIFTGFEIGQKIHTGLRLMNSNIQNSPVKDVFRISIPLSNEDKNGRMSWDETAVLIAVYGTDRFFEIKHGNITVKNDGSNGWEDSPEGKQLYVIQKMPVREMENFIEDRMMHQPFIKKAN
jgi:pyrimidine-specific ribonucleoside hydrolase